MSYFSSKNPANCPDSVPVLSLLTFQRKLYNSDIERQKTFGKTSNKKLARQTNQTLTAKNYSNNY